jgi:triosephosphate isomerase
MASQRTYLIAGNWKMNGNLSLADQMVTALSQLGNKIDVLICPPFPYLSAVAGKIKLIGGQNLSQFESGAHTGEVSASMLKELGCSHVIVGHSERREDNGETDSVIAEKVAVALSNGLKPVVCIGESLQAREAGNLFEFIQSQLDAVVDKVGIEAFADLVLAYEPIWAIGTGVTATPEQAQEVHGFIRGYLAEKNEKVAQNIQILYGGSMNAANAEQLLSQPDVDGGLIGGSSLKPADFLTICETAESKV